MPNFRELDWKTVYKTGEDDLLSDFYIPALSRSVTYDRSVGFFSAGILLASLRGLAPFLANNGRIRLIIGHPLSPEEYAAVTAPTGQEFAKQKISELCEAQLFSDAEDEANLPKAAVLLGNLVSAEALSIKFAFRLKGMHHEKVGILTDAVGDQLVFEGSANETIYGLDQAFNAEGISVYPSWRTEVFQDYAEPYKNSFSELWAGRALHTKTLDISSELYARLASSAGEGASDFERLDSYEQAKFEVWSRALRTKLLPEIPDNLNGKKFEIRPHQKQAIRDWQEHKLKGILQLSTGSGKTITAICAAILLQKERAKRGLKTVLVISVPYIELATQWAEVLVAFNIFPTKVWGSRMSWEGSLRTEISAHNLSEGSSFLSMVCVNASLAGDAFQRCLDRLDPRQIIFIGDECHNHGAENLQSKLPEAAYRLGLSATPFRSAEEEVEIAFPDVARERIESFYGSVVSRYDLSDAIMDGVLCGYDYHLVPVYLSASEQEIYDQLSSEIGAIVAAAKDGILTPSQKLSLNIATGTRSRLLGSIDDKQRALTELISKIPASERKQTLVYCGEGRPVDADDDGYDQQDDERTIETASRIFEEGKWRTTRFTSYESSAARKAVMNSFKSGEIDALISMKVLDEGVDVPACRTAIITASTRNPRQFVQRRGRVLRKSPGKEKAIIYDFVTLPSVGADPRYSSTLIGAELERVDEFCAIADNKLQIERVVDELGMRNV